MLLRVVLAGRFGRSVFWSSSSRVLVSIVYHKKRSPDSPDLVDLRLPRVEVLMVRPYWRHPMMKLVSPLHSLVWSLCFTMELASKAISTDRLPRAVSDERQVKQTARPLSLDPCRGNQRFSALAIDPQFAASCRTPLRRRPPASGGRFFRLSRMNGRHNRSFYPVEWLFTSGT